MSDLSDVASLQDRFWPKVRITDGCWEWTGSLNSKGYGQISFRGRSMRAHAAIFKIYKEEIPKGYCIDHICRNRKCVRRWHLRIVTPRENTIFNSESIPAKNFAKTHCPKGHPYSKENTKIKINCGRPYRRCRRCENDYKNEWQRQQRRLGKIL